MSLSSSEHRRLAAIADHLMHDDPALAALLAGFTGPPQCGASPRAERATLWRRVVGHGLMPVLLFALAPLFIAIGLAAGIPAFLMCGCALAVFTPLLAVLWSTRFWSGRPAFG